MYIYKCITCLVYINMYVSMCVSTHTHIHTHTHTHTHTHELCIYTKYICIPLGAPGQAAWAAARLHVDLLLKLAWAHDALSQSRTKFVKALKGGGEGRGGLARGPVNGTRGGHELRQSNAGSKIRVGSREKAQRHLAAAAHSANSANSARSANAGPKARVGSRENAQRHQERALECYGRALDLISSVNATAQERAVAGAPHPATFEDSASFVNATNAAVGRNMDEERAVCWYLRAQILEHRISGDRLTNLLASVGAYREADHGEDNLKSLSLLWLYIVDILRG